ncbi:MAG: TIGR03915 family putative DNA repair protein [Treponema sp.]|jgi:probable DNA metabolism protein|nr:TIGR03915 family putative DNA repair protein [Treponema sp.]
MNLYEAAARQYDKTDIDFLAVYFSGKFDCSYLNEENRTLFELSSSAFDTALHAWLSELPIEREIDAFGKKVLAAAQIAASAKEKRGAAERAAQDRGDPNTLVVLNAAGKVLHEVHRMMGLLRFSPDSNGEFIARFAPDHFILPALAEFFAARFGETPWSIIDEKRGLCLRRISAENPKITVLNEKICESQNLTVSANGDEWENLWKHYHQTINNEERNNPGLQRQLMPKRYWKYLPEKSM